MIFNNEALSFINKIKLPNDIKQNINSFLIDYNLYFKQSKIKMQETFSIIDKGIKLVPLYKLENLSNQICNECYAYCLIKRTVYNTNNCFHCNYFIENGARLLKYIEVDFESFKQYRHLFLIDSNIRQIFILNKYLSENILIYYLDIIFTVKSATGILSEIKKGPRNWTIKQKKLKVLLKYYNLQ